jgi:hypothetical protein
MEVHRPGVDGPEVPMRADDQPVVAGRSIDAAYSSEFIAV